VIHQPNAALLLNRYLSIIVVEVCGNDPCGGLGTKKPKKRFILDWASVKSPSMITHAGMSLIILRITGPIFHRHKVREGRDICARSASIS